jgi:hypothetical protein
MKVAVLGGFLCAGVWACAHGAGHGTSSGALPAPPMTSLALRIVDSSRAKEPVLGVRVRLIGPMPQQETVACSDSTRQPVLWITKVRPGRYQLVMARPGYERRLVLVDVAQHQTDTVTVGLSPVARDLETKVVTAPAMARCGRTG